MKTRVVFLSAAAVALALGVAFNASSVKSERVTSAKMTAISPAKPHYTLERIPASAVHHGRAGIPNIRIADSTSGNWSGYAVQTSQSSPATVFTDVQGSWTVPHVTGSKGAYTYSSTWVGIDGYSNGTVEQLGTEDDWTGKTERHYAWFEMYPDWAYMINGFTVAPGDKISAQVKYDAANGVFFLIINNVTENETFTTDPLPLSTALRTSAEWIVEAPWSSRILPLANFGTVTFVNCTANGNPINSWAFIDPLTMASGSGRKLTIQAQPTDLSKGGKGFSVVWNHQ